MGQYTIKKYSTILQPTQVSMDLNSCNLQHFEHRVLHHVRDAVLSGNTFEVPLKISSVLMVYWPEAFGKHCYFLPVINSNNKSYNFPSTEHKPFSLPIFFATQQS